MCGNAQDAKIPKWLDLPTKLQCVSVHGCSLFHLGWIHQQKRHSYLEELAKPARIEEICAHHVMWSLKLTCFATRRECRSCKTIALKNTRPSKGQRKKQLQRVENYPHNNWHSGLLCQPHWLDSHELQLIRLRLCHVTSPCHLATSACWGDRTEAGNKWAFNSTNKANPVLADLAQMPFRHCTTLLLCHDASTH